MIGCLYSLQSTLQLITVWLNSARHDDNTALPGNMIL
jgi:hypothetical protein